MNRVLLTATGLVSLTFVFMLFAAQFSKFDPIAWTPGHNPGLTGQFQENNQLSKLQQEVKGVGVGPEEVVYGPDGFFYTGLEDGRIIRFIDSIGSSNTGIKHSQFADTGGRPLGLRFDRAGNLIVADSERGLLSISAKGIVTVLTDSVNGQKMLFVDALDIADNGTIWFSDMSTRYDHHNVNLDFVEARPTGRLLSYSPASGETQIRLEGIHLANGVALGPDENYILVSETGRGKIHRLWLKGKKAGQRDLFFEGLPGVPDNVTFNGVDTFWVAMPYLRSPVLDALADKPWLRRFIPFVPEYLIRPSNYGAVIGIDLEGKVKYNLQDSDARFHTITSAFQIDDTLYLGSAAMKSVGRLSLSVLDLAISK